MAFFQSVAHGSQPQNDNKIRHHLIICFEWETETTSLHVIWLCRRGWREEQAGRKRIVESGGERDATNPRPVLPSATSLSVSSFLRSPQNADHADALAVIWNYILYTKSRKCTCYEWHKLTSEFYFNVTTFSRQSE